MKNLFTWVLLLFATGLLAQAPQSIPYQAIAMDAEEEIIANEFLGVEIQLLEGAASGRPVYAELHTVESDENGLFQLNIGRGYVTYGSFTNMYWKERSYFVKVQLDVTGGTDHETVGTVELLSVPYALFAAQAANGPPGLQGPSGDIGPPGVPGSSNPPGTPGLAGPDCKDHQDRKDHL